ncbi:MAG: alanine racemase [Planctomycetota bacterium]
MKIMDLETPAFLIDLEKLKRNIRRMQERAKRAGLKLRPHMKTHKTVEIGCMQIEGNSAGITVSTLAEAEFFADAGFADITYAFPITPNKLARAAELTARLKGFHVLLDHRDTADSVIRSAEARNIQYSVFLKVDPGYHRAGVDPVGDESIHIADLLHTSQAVDFSGILTHGGHSYHCRNPGEVGIAAREERSALTGLAQRLAKEGIPCPVVSAGSTPTAVHGDNWEGVTELRPGNYVFFDKFQADIGTCTMDDCAASVLATVAGHYPQRNQLLIDAGSLALSKDPGAAHMHAETVFGAIPDHPDLEVQSLSQEHGLIGSGAQIPFEDFPLGCRVRIIPNHSCLTAALFPRYHVVRGEEVIDEWIPVRGW